MDEEDLTLLYRPDINIERDYRSDGIILHEPKTNEPETEPPIPQTPIEEVIEQARETTELLYRIRNITSLLPQEMQETTEDLLDVVILNNINNTYALEEIAATEEEDKYEVYPELHEYETETQSYTFDDEDWPEMTSSGFTFIIENNKDNWDLAQEQYLFDSTAITKIFADDYNDKMQNYVYQLMTAMDEVGLSDPIALNQAYEGETVDGIPSNYQNLSDRIVREQDNVAEYADLFKKTHDMNTTNEVFAAYDIAAQSRVRYLKEQYKNEAADSYLDVYDREYLAKSRDEYEHRYQNSRNDLYRFLHSAVEISGILLLAQLMVAVCKCSLLKKKVNVFKKKEPKTSAVNNSTTAKGAIAKSEDDKKKTEEVKKEDEKKKAENSEAKKATDKKDPDNQKKKLEDKKNKNPLLGRKKRVVDKSKPNFRDYIAGGKFKPQKQGKTKTVNRDGENVKITQSLKQAKRRAIIKGLTKNEPNT